MNNETIVLDDHSSIALKWIAFCGADLTEAERIKVIEATRGSKSLRADVESEIKKLIKN